ncbi:aspartyl protease-like protein [Aphelenchoides avenae]|nr:aspartyl protease-like protein [Aphelenchus avenae]
MVTQKQSLLLLCLSVFFETGANDGDVLRQTLFSSRDSFYGASFQVGTPAQDVYLNVVFGWAITTDPKIKVASSKCAECCFGQTFNSTASTTFKKDQSVKSDDNEMSDRGRDTLTVLGEGGKAVQLESQPLDVVTSEGEANVFTLQPFDGIIDLSSNTNNVAGVLANAGLIKASVYTIYMERTCTNDVSQGGTITYGAVDSTNCKPVSGYVPATQVKGSNPNTIAVDSISLGSASSSLKWNARVAANGPMLVPTKVFTAISSAWNAKPREMNGRTRWIVDCDKEFDPLVLSIGGQTYTIPYYAYVRREVDECHLAIIDTDVEILVNSGYLSLGLPFSYQHCVVFDIANSKIGLTKHQGHACYYNPIICW